MRILTKVDLNLTTAISFNTGRLYRDDGQRIYACRDKEDKLTIMVDVSRGLEYAFECECTQAAIMHHYDHNLQAKEVYVSWQVGDALVKHFNPY